MNELGQWFSGVGRTTCEECKAVYGEENTPCGTCWPGVHPYNLVALNVYSQCSNQYIMGPSGPVELDMKAAFMIMDLYKIPEEEKLDVWDRIQAISHTLLSEQREETKRKAKQKSGQSRGY